MPIDRKALAKVQAEIDSTHGNAKFWKLKPGRHKFRLIADWPNSRGVYFRDIATHYNVGPEKAAVVCTKMTSSLAVKSDRHCWLCDKVVELMGSDRPADQKMGEAMRANTRYIMNVYVRPTATEGGGLKIAQFPKTVHDAIYELVMYPEDHGEITDLAEGHDIIIEREGSGLETRYSTTPATKATPLHTTEKEINAILEAAVDLNKFAIAASSEKMEAIFNGDTEEEEAAPRHTRRREEPAEEEEEPAEDEDDDEEEPEEEEEEPQAKAKVKKKAAPVEAEEEEEAEGDEDDDEEDEKPKAKKKAAPATATLASLRSRLGR